MANWHLNYGVNYKALGDKKMNCNVTHKGGNGVQVVLGGGIPDAPGVDLESIVGPLVDKHLAGLDNLDADDPQSHVKVLRANAAYCTELADLMGGN